MAQGPSMDRDVVRRQAQAAVLARLVRCDDVDGLLDAVSPHHHPGRFTPDVAMLELAVTALDLACTANAEPLRYEGLRERYLPEIGFRGRTEHRNSQYALYAAACIRGGLRPDLLSDAGWWLSPLWEYAVFALISYTRAAAERLDRASADVARSIPERHALRVDGDSDAAGPAGA